jgi:hypothetical protein
VLLLFNASKHRCTFCLPAMAGWRVEVDTAMDRCGGADLDGQEYVLADRSFALLRADSG